ncbi:molybdopterin oxidoreductase family protein [Oceaniserpentilla sp. 4NH20-0058]|uniref:molybdopterin oxidoreductase family protein n=1 Tax=Oceaniserpentilla sp. 4NH20-0058 TaxID=3127660 RepID=UPI00310250ED
MTDSQPTQTHYRTCNLCEAMCGVKIEHQGTTILSIKGDENDLFSQGHICPKAVALQDLYEDPDRIKTPMERTADGWKEISWEAALDKAAAGIKKVQNQYGNNALGLYLGNPNVHNLGGSLMIRHIIKALNTRTRFSATSVDQLPHHMIAMHLFGHQHRIPVPDINRTQHMVIMGANPLASNGSIMTVANVRQKIKDIKKRGGKVVVIDPRKSETADLASEHHFIKPSSDVVLLLAMVNYIFSHNLVKPSAALALAKGYEAIADYVKEYSLELASSQTGIAQRDIETLIVEFCQAENAVFYGRMGVSVQEFGLLSQYLIMLINLLTGSLDEEGGMMFPTPAVELVASGGPGYFNKRQTRVRGLPDYNGEFPSVTMSEEILTQGEGQMKAMVTIAGNPVLSTPNGQKLDEALDSLDFMVCIDYYLNETTRHANIILPPVSPIERDHYDTTFHTLAVHNTAKFSPAMFELPENAKHDWQIYLELAKRLQGEVSEKEQAIQTMAMEQGPNVLLDAMLKAGPYDLDLAKVKAATHGIDLGPLESRLPDGITHDDKTIHLNLEFYFADLNRLQASLADQTKQQTNSDALLIGRRHVRSNNSWMHNSQRLVKGKSRCTLLIHPDQAAQLNIADGQSVKVTSRVGSVVIEAQISEEIMPGVVSIPHGYGHGRKGIKQGVAEANAGVSVNDLTDENMIDGLSGNAAVNGVPVSLLPVAQKAVS